LAIEEEELGLVEEINLESR